MAKGELHLQFKPELNVVQDDNLVMAIAAPYCNSSSAVSSFSANPTTPTAKKAHECAQDCLTAYAAMNAVRLRSACNRAYNAKGAFGSFEYVWILEKFT